MATSFYPGTAFDEFFQVPIGRVIIDGAGGTDFIHTVDNFDQVLFGGDLRDLIISEGTGNDLIFGDSSGEGAEGADDSVFLRDAIAAGRGNDIVFAQTGPDYVNGEQGDDHIHGGFGGDFLQGGSGNDFVEGGVGNDILFGGTTPGTIPVGFLFTVTTDHNGISGAGPVGPFDNSLSGDEQSTTNTGSDFLVGGDGNDALHGQDGIDRLVGGPGSDSFFFETALGSANIDSVLDFEHGVDKIVLSKATFTSPHITDGTLSRGEFYIGKKAHDKSDTIIYNKKTGDLSYDDDGKGNHPGVVFAHLDAHLKLSNADFLIV